MLRSSTVTWSAAGATAAQGWDLASGCCGREAAAHHERGPKHDQALP